MSLTSERMQKIDLVLKTIPTYDGNTNALNTFISTVDLVHDILLTLNPELDAFENSTVFLYLRSKIIGRALESIKDLEPRSWSTLREILIANFSNKSNSITILNNILNIKSIKNPSYFFEVIKEKFNDFKSRLLVENNNMEGRKAIVEFVEKLIITHFITNLNDPFRNNLATRNPKSLDEVELLVKNDLQYLRAEQNNKPLLNNQYAFKQGPPNKNINRNSFGQHKSPNRSTFGNGIINNNRTVNLPKPEPMSVQIRQTRPWQRESYNNNSDDQGPSEVRENQNDSELFQNSFLELSQIEVEENP